MCNLNFLIIFTIFQSSRGESAGADDADNKGFFQWFNSGQDLQGEISTSDGFCYGSGICVNRCGVLAVCDRRLSEVKFYRLVAAG